MARTENGTTAMAEVDRSSEWGETILKILKKHVRKDDDDQTSIFSNASVVSVPGASS